MSFINVVYPNLTNADHAGLHLQGVELFEEAGFQNPKAVSLVNVYKTKYGIESEALKKIVRSAMSQDLAETDKKRDIAIKGMFDENKNKQRHFDPEVVAAARILDEPLKTYGRNIYKLKYTAETAMVVNLVADLKSPKYIVHVKKAGLEDWLTEVERQNNEFMKLYKERDNQKANITEIVLREARGETDEALVAALNFVDALMLVEGEENYKEFVRKFNIVLSRYGGKKKPSSEGGEEEEGETPVTEDKYPDAKEWTNMVDVNDFKLGDICFVVVEGVKKYYKMIDESNFNVRPNGGEGELGWEPIE